MRLCPKHGIEKLDRKRIRRGRLVNDFVCLECARENSRVHRANNPRREPIEQRRARKKVAKALKSGRLIKQPCQVCGSTSVQGHHEDYSKPLVVVWLCRTHHMAAHKRLAIQNVTVTGPFRPTIVKLTESQAEEIRLLAGTVRNIDLARRYGISDGHVANIIRGIKWKGSTEEPGKGRELPARPGA